MDFLTWRMASTVYGSGHAAATAALALTILSPWQWFCSVRTFSNSLEATLTTCSLCYFPWAYFLGPSTNKTTNRAGFGAHEYASPRGLYIALTAAAAAFYLRPTNIIIWLSISACLVWYNRDFARAVTLIQAATLVGITVVITFASVDRIYYSGWTFPPLRFLQFNVVQSLAVFYGKNRPDYYVTEGLPLLLTTALPFALVGVYLSLCRRSSHTSQSIIQERTVSVFAATIISSVLALSLIAHKEVRFIYPLLPMLHVLAARPLASSFSTKKIGRLMILAAGIAINIYIAYYVSFVHQRGVVDVVHYLRHRQESWFDASPMGHATRPESANITVGFLMPCHSTPWRSHFVYPEITAWALTCEPPIHMPTEERALYLDEADIFYNEPLRWLANNMQDRDTISLTTTSDVTGDPSLDDRTRRPWPHYLVAFESLQPTLASVLNGTRYKECKRFFNTHWHDDSRRTGDVIVWCMRR